MTKLLYLLFTCNSLIKNQDNDTNTNKYCCEDKVNCWNNYFSNEYCNGKDIFLDDIS